MSGATRKHPGINLGEFHGRAHDKAENLVFGFWVFMMSDIIVFGLLRTGYPEAARSMEGAAVARRNRP